MDGRERRVNVEDLMFVLDRVVCLAWKAAHCKIKGEIEVFGTKVIVSPVGRFYFPATPDFKVLLAHLKAYGILTNCNPNIEPEKCPVKFPMTAHRMKMFEQYGKEAGKPVFILAYENSDRWKITRKKPSGKEQGNTTINISLPHTLHAALKKLALNDFVTLSVRCRQILTEYVKSTGILDKMTLREDDKQ